MKSDTAHFSAFYGVLLLSLLLLPLVLALGLAFRRKFVEWYRGTRSET
ncbi:hypothetical protein [Dyadobacter sandarakinus]|uniref:Uncharacterized protein n=1 Tax=Dyadobacter sandarakinus TaxID=2747268 RepID=A0ABX7I4I9_9BACT|nr:hypothetical protein [Dyadobacter sandarakinus]QRR01001.1 hypothetical protein HWI92_08855 [Dyadobacter sandarakinus]